MTKLTRHIPNSMTLFNIAIGLAAVLLSYSGEYEKAAGLILVSVIVDCFDGYVARKLKSTSKIGGYMDTVSDFLSFGVATGILMMKMFMINNLIILFYIFSSGFRLLYFMKTNNPSFFYGLPTTVTGGFLATAVILGTLDRTVTNYIMIILSIMMLSRIKYYRIELRGRRTISVLLAAVLSLFVLDFILAIRVISFMFLGYMAFGWLRINEPR